MKLLQVLVLIFGLVVLANAQKTSLSGTVYDSNGAVILGTKVYATNAKGRKIETIVNTDGNYLLELPIGIYTIEFNSANFKSVRFENYQVVNSNTGKMCLDISLSVVGTGVVGVLTVESPKNNKRKSNNKSRNKFIKRKINKI